MAAPRTARAAPDGPGADGPAPDGPGPGDGFGGAVLRRTPQQARSRDKVARALAAAESLLAREGPDALTLTRVAREAGVSAGALHQYLPDRDAIARALLARYHARFEATLAALVEDRPGPGADPVGAVVDAFAELYRGSAGVRGLGRDGGQGSAAHKARMVVLVDRLLHGWGLLPGGEGTDEEGSGRPVARTVFTTADALMHEAFGADPGGDLLLLAELRRVLRAYLGLA